MNFTIDGSQGAVAAGQGIGSMFKAAAMAPLLRQQAEVDSALKGAQIYHHTMAGNKLGTEAEQKRGALAMQNDPLENTMLSLGLPTSLAPAFRERISTGQWGGSYAPPVDGVGPTMPAPANDDTVKKLAQAMSLTQRMFATGSNVDQGAGAALKEQKARGIDAVVANPALAANVGMAYAAANGKPLFNNVGNTGASMNNFTGEIDPVVAKLFAETQNALSGQRNAAAGLSNARRDRVTSGLDKPVTIIDDASGQASVTAIPTNGDPRTIGVAPAKGTGADATNAKTRNQVIAAVEKDLAGASEDEIAAEVSKRLSRRGISDSGNKNPKPNTNKPKIPNQSVQFKSADEVKAAFKEGKISREDAMATLQRDFGMK